MKIVICPDSFKGSISAKDAAIAIHEGMKSVLPDAEYSILPMADGGEGTMDSLLFAIGGKKYKVSVHDPLGRKINAEYAILSDGTGVIEMACASGLPLLKPEERNPLITSTFGTGELIVALARKKVKSILIGVGGSATVDGGMGMAKALGVKFLSGSGKQIPEGGGFLGRIEKIDISGMNKIVSGIDITVLCDVQNPLTGKNGAARIFGPQKGANKKMVEILENNLRHYAKIIRKQLKKDIEHLPGSGAAGGLSAGLVAFLNARIEKGSRFVAQKIGLEKHLRQADIVISGEGKIDRQVRFGKTLLAVLEEAKKYDVCVIALCGIKSGNLSWLHKNGLTSVFSIVPGIVSLEDAMKNAKYYLTTTSKEVAGLLKCFCQNKLKK